MWVTIALAAALLLVGRAAFWHRGIDKPSAPSRREHVVIITDAAMTTGCRAMREITLSSAANGTRGDHSEDDRDRDLDAIATAAGANVVLVLERRPDLIHGWAYRCPDPERHFGD